MWLIFLWLKLILPLLLIKMMESIIIVSEDPTKTSVVWNINFYAMLSGHNMNSLALCAVYFAAN